MKKTFIAVVVAILGCVEVVIAADIAEMDWAQSNIDALRSFDKDAVVRLVNQVAGNEDSGDAATRDNIGEIAWVDLAGDGRVELLVTVAGSRAFYNSLAVYMQDSSGKVSHQQQLTGWMISDLGKVVRDLDGDRRKELVIPIQFPPGAYWGAKPMAGWPVVYRLRNGTYVEASRDFPNFYDDEVLPQLQDRIKDTQKQIATGLKGEAQLAVLEMSRDKILRVLRRDPTAGLAKAREWANTDDPELLGDAIVVFRDIGGHEDELRAAELAGQRALAAEKAARMGQ
jgi:hypothetical protein